MREVKAWLSRLRVAAPSQLSEYQVRLVYSGTAPLDIPEGLVRVRPLDPHPPQPGDTGPRRSSLLRFIDTKDETQPISVHQRLAAEFGALLTLATDRRIEPPNELVLPMYGGSSILFIGQGASTDRRLNAPLPSGVADSFAGWLRRIESLGEPHATTIGAACNLHHAACLLFIQELRSAYILLVAGVEVLSRQYGSPPLSWSDWDQSQAWDAFLKQQGLSQMQREAFVQRLMADKQLRLKAAFRHYASSRILDSFWDATWTDWDYPLDFVALQWKPPQPLAEIRMRDIIPQDRSLLSKALGRSYDLRSGLVHRGDWPGPPQTTLPTPAAVTPDAPVPFAALRTILTELIKIELLENTVETDLPAVRVDPRAPPERP
jgi:hypothetical protein